MTVSALAGHAPSATAFAVLRARDDLPTTYHIALTHETVVYNSTPPRPPDREYYRVEVWSRPPLVRTDRWPLASSTSAGSVGTRWVVCRGCERVGYAMTAHTGVRDGRVEVGFDRIDADFDRLDRWRIDWRRLGIMHASLALYSHEPPDSTMRNVAKAKRATVTRAERGGHECALVRRPFDNGDGHRDAWFRPDRGMNPVYFEHVSDAGRSRSTTDVTYARTAGVSHWYPSSVTHDYVEGGREVLSEKITIEAAEFGTPIPDKVFTLDGVGLDEGQSVAFPEIKDANDTPVWRNGKLDWVYTSGKAAADNYALKMQQLEASSPPTPDAPPPANGWLYYAGAAALTVAAAVLFVLARRSRKPA